MAVIAGFLLGILMKVYIQFQPQYPSLPALAWMRPFAMQGILNWAFCTTLCVIVSAFTPPPAPEHVSDELVINWRNLNVFAGLGEKWYTGVVFWWALFAAIIIALMIMFSGVV